MTSKDFKIKYTEINREEKDELFQPFQLPKKNFNYFLLTELKPTGSDTDIQELDLYCVPSVSYTHLTLPTICSV